MRISDPETLKRKFPFLLWLIFCGCAVLWLCTRPPELSFEVRAERNFQLRVYHTAGKNFGDKLFLQEIVTPAREKFGFSLPLRTCRIRLDLGKEPGNTVTIRNFALRRNRILLNKAKEPDGKILKPVRDIVREGSSFKVTGSRPELEVAEDFIRTREPDLRQLSLFLLVFLLGSILLLSLSWEDWGRLGQQAVRSVAEMRLYCRKNTRFLVYAFGCLIVIFGYELFNQPISDDDDWYLLSRYEQRENSMPGAYSTFSYPSLTDNFISHGRWTSAVCLKIFTGYCPVLSLFWCLFCFTLLFLFLTEKLALPPGARYLLYPLFIAQPVFCEYHSFFMTYNTYGLSCLVMFLAAYHWSRSRDWRITGLLIAAALFFTSSLQSLILLFPLWFLLEKMSGILENRIDYRKSFTELLKLCGICLLVLAGYFLALKFTLWVFETEWQYLGNFIQKPDSVKAVLRFGRDLMKKMLSVYSGEFEFTIHGQLLLFLLMAAAILSRLIREKRSVADLLAMTAALTGCLILPFLLDIATFSTIIPVRSMVSFPVMMTGLCILGWRSLDDRPRIRTAAGLLVVFVSVQYGILLNQKAYASKLRYDQDRSVLQSIKDRCYGIPEFAASVNEKRKIPLAVVGNLTVPRNRTFPMWCDSMLNCSFEPALVVNLHLLGETFFYPASASEMRRVFPAAMSMPSWPAPGSVRYENGILIVKLSGFNAAQCRQYGFPFCTATRDNSIQQLEKIASPVRPFWTLKPETLDSVSNCTADFSGGSVTVKSSGWHSLHTKAVKADPGKTYYLQMELRCRKKSGFLYLGFADPARYGEEVITETGMSGRETETCILRIPGTYLQGPVTLLTGGLGRKVQIEKMVLYELTGPEDLLKK